MSNVPVRLRNLSSMEHYTQAVAVRKMVLQIVSGPHVKKSLRFTFAVPMAETARSLVNNVVTANAFYPNTPDNVTMRKRHLTLAIADCEVLYQDIQCLLSVDSSIRPSSFDRINAALDREVALLKGSRKGVKLIGKNADK